MMKKTEVEALIRNAMLQTLTNALNDNGDEVLVISANELAVPCVDAEGNDSFCVIKVSVPRGVRKSEGGYIPFDGYKAAEEYALDVEEKAEAKRIVEEKKAAKIAADKARREARAEKAKAKAEAAKAKLAKASPQTEEG